VKNSFWGAENIIAVGEKTSQVCGRVGWDVEDVPDLGGGGEGCPL